jgi:hypothetical protein
MMSVSILVLGEPLIFFLFILFDNISLSRYSILSLFINIQLFWILILDIDLIHNNKHIFFFSFFIKPQSKRRKKHDTLYYYFYTYMKRENCRKKRRVKEKTSCFFTQDNLFIFEVYSWLISFLSCKRRQ